MDYPRQPQGHLDGLNEQQRDAVLCDAKIVYVDAGPGTGKTHMLASKLVEYILSSETSPKVVALSYTNTAARSLGERFRERLAASGVTREFELFSGTIHSFCFRMMKVYSTELSRLFDYVILDEEELQELAADIKESLSEEVSLKQILSCLHSDRRDIPEDLFNEVARVKMAYKVLSMQDILANFAKAIDEDDGFRQWLSRQVTVIAIDEAQDLTELYYSIIDRMIASIPGLKVFLVGDPRQNIFEFNGGSYRNLHDFLSRHASHETKHLSITYRCPRAVAEYVNTFHFSDCENLELQSRSGAAGRLIVKQTQSEGHETDYVLNRVLEQENLDTCAVLCNNLRYLGTLIDRLCLLKIPYRVLGGRKSVKRHVRFLNHVLRVIDSDNAYSLRKVAQYAGVDITDTDGRKKRRLFYESELGAVIRDIRQRTLGFPFREILQQVLDRIMRDPSDDESVRGDYDLLEALSVQYPGTADYLLAFATDKERFSQFFVSDYVECPVDASGDALTLSTIHSAKGLEWPHVFVVGLCEGNFPNEHFATGLSEADRAAFFNGETKKMYVASTRAKESLTLTCPASIMRKGYVFRKQPSRFIRALLAREKAPAPFRGYAARP